MSSLTAGGGRRSTQEHTHHVLLQAPNPFPPPRLHRAPLAVPIPTETCQQTGYIVLEWMTTAAYGFGGFWLASAVYWANLGLWQQWDNIRVATWQDGAGLRRSHVRAAAVTQAQAGGGMCGVACASEREALLVLRDPRRDAVYGQAAAGHGWHGGGRGAVQHSREALCIKQVAGVETRLRSYHGECTGSRPLSEVKLRWAGVVLWSETTRERSVLQAFFFFLPFSFSFYHYHTFSRSLF